MQWLLVLVLGCNIGLILWGVYVVPATLATSGGIGALMAPLGLQVVVALLALIGPLSFPRYRSSIGISLLFGALFALAYDGIILLDMLGISADLNIWLLFVSAASLAGFFASYQTTHFDDGWVYFTQPHHLSKHQPTGSLAWMMRLSSKMRMNRRWQVITVLKTAGPKPVGFIHQSFISNETRLGIPTFFPCIFGSSALCVKTLAYREHWRR
jgi:hypothetical protein